MRFKVLVVDDEAESRTFMKSVLDGNGYTTLLASGAADAVLAALDSRPDLVLSDIAMPVVDGFGLCRRLKDDPRTAAIPVILMSGAHTAQDDQAEGIELGADDYLLKPFTPRLMLAKIRGVLRRYEAPGELGEVLRAHGLTLDVQARTLASRRGRLSLTRKEFDLLTTFLRKPGKVLSVPYLLETVWGYDPADYNDAHTVETHVSSLRRKLGKELGKLFVNVSGLGYRFDQAPS